MTSGSGILMTSVAACRQCDYIHVVGGERGMSAIAVGQNVTVQLRLSGGCVVGPC